MLVLYWAGRWLEEIYGGGEFLAFYLVGGIFANCVNLAVDAAAVARPRPGLGASGAVTATLVLFAFHFPWQQRLHLVHVADAGVALGRGLCRARWPRRGRAWSRWNRLRRSPGRCAVRSALLSDRIAIRRSTHAKAAVAAAGEAPAARRSAAADWTTTTRRNQLGPRSRIAPDPAKGTTRSRPRSMPYWRRSPNSVRKA